MEIEDRGRQVHIADYELGGSKVRIEIEAYPKREEFVGSDVGIAIKYGPDLGINCEYQFKKNSFGELRKFQLLTSDNGIPLSQTRARIGQTIEDLTLVVSDALIVEEVKKRIGEEEPVTNN